MYGFKKQVNIGFESAVEKVRIELSKEGFGVITEIDVKATLKKKLDVDFDNYIILGACNPSYAYNALNKERDIGLFLPCNVIIYEQKNRVFVSAMMPSNVINLMNNPELECIANEVEPKLKRVVDNI